MISVEDFRDLPESSIAQVGGKAVEPTFDLAHRGGRRFAYRQLREEERSNEPRPHRSLVVSTRHGSIHLPGSDLDIEDRLAIESADQSGVNNSSSTLWMTRAAGCPVRSG